MTNHQTRIWLQHQLNLIIERDHCARVGSLLRDEALSDTQRLWVVTEIGRLSNEETLEKTVDAIPDELLDLVVVQTVNRRLWNIVASLLQRPVTNEKRKWAVVEAMQHAEDGGLEKVLPRCAHDQLEAVVKEAVTRGLWTAVGKLIQREVNESQRAWLVDEAIQHADDDNLQVVLCHCTEDQLDLALETAVNRRLWSAVVTLLRREIKDATRSWAVEKAIESEAVEHLEQILCECAEDQTDRVLEAAVTMELWGAVESLLSRGPDDAWRRWAVEEATKHASDDELKKLIQEHYWDVDQRDLMLTLAVTGGLWGSVAELLRFGVVLQQRQWAVLEATKQAPDELLKEIIGYHVALQQGSFGFDSDHSLEMILPSLFEQDRWSSLLALFVCSSDFSEEQRLLIIKEAGKRATGKTLEAILCYRLGKLPDSVFADLLDRQQWDALAKNDIHHAASELRSQIIIEASKHAEESTLESFLKYLNYEPKQLVDCVMTEAISRGYWSTATKLLHYRSLSDSLKRRAVQELMTNAEDKEFSEAVHYCEDDQLDFALEKAVTKRRWLGVSYLVGRKVSDKTCTWAVEEAVQYADGESLLKILQSCSDKLLKSVLMDVVCKRRYPKMANAHQVWFEIASFTANRFSEEEQNRFIVEAGKNATDQELSEFLVGLADTPPEMALKTAMQRHLWDVASLVLCNEINQTFRAQAVEQAIQHAEDKDLALILPHCADEQLDSVLAEAVQRGLWDCVTKLLRRGPSDEAFDLAVGEASKRASDEELSNLLRDTKLAQYQLGCALTEATTRGLRESVLQLLELGVSDQSQNPTVYDSSELATGDVSDDRLHFDKSDLLGSVLQNLLREELWGTLQKILTSKNLAKKVSDDMRAQILKEVCRHADELHLQQFLAICPDSLLDHVITKAVERGLWTVVGVLLQRPMSRQMQMRAIEQAMTHAGNAEFSSIILHCIDDQLESALTEAVERRLWEDVVKLLKRNVGNREVLQRAICEASMYAENDVLLEIITDVPRSVTGEPWFGVVVLRLLGREVKEMTVARRRVGATAKQEWDAALKSILSACSDNLLDRALAKAVRGRLWGCVETLLARGVSHAKQDWALREASKHANEDQLQALFRYCTRQQLPYVMTEVAKRQLWGCIQTILSRATVSRSSETLQQRVQNLHRGRRSDVGLAVGDFDARFPLETFCCDWHLEAHEYDWLLLEVCEHAPRQVIDELLSSLLHVDTPMGQARSRALTTLARRGLAGALLL